MEYWGEKEFFPISSNIPILHIQKAEWAAKMMPIDFKKIPTPCYVIDERLLGITLN